MIAELVISACLVLGGFFALAGSIGLARLPDFYCRLHGPTKATTLGVGGLLVGSMLYFSLLEEGVIVHELLIAVFLFMSAPVSAHLLARAALHLGIDAGTAGSPAAGTDPPDHEPPPAG